MTGRGMGYCAGYDAPGYGRGVFGVRFAGRRFFGRGAWGGGYGHRHGFYATGMPGWAHPVGYWDAVPYPPPPTTAERVEVLRAQAEAMRGELAAIERSLAALEQQEEMGEQGE